MRAILKGFVLAVLTIYAIYLVVGFFAAVASVDLLHETQIEIIERATRRSYAN